MHERSPKSSAMDVLLYEREMLQHCAETVNDKQARFTQSLSDQDRAEYYLGIEGFLLHFRNLLVSVRPRPRRPLGATDGIVSAMVMCRHFGQGCAYLKIRA